ncbi:MAG TPA: hypothetical protein VEF89_12505 [Solirubrobacteraceae bacterium]|nr:hypothetical protein [Solirubrobacteraceae bacterium]
MQSEVETHRSRTPAVARKAAAGLVLLVVAALALKIIIGFVTAIFWTVVVIAAVLAVLWAVKTLVW